MNEKESFPAAAALALSSVLACSSAQKPPDTAAETQDDAVVVDLQHGTPKPPVDLEETHTAAPKVVDSADACPVILSYEDAFNKTSSQRKHKYTDDTLDVVCPCITKIEEETANARAAVTQACDDPNNPPLKYSSYGSQMCQVARMDLKNLVTHQGAISKACQDNAKSTTPPAPPGSVEALEASLRANLLEPLKSLSCLDIMQWRSDMENLVIPLRFLDTVKKGNKP